MTTMVLAAQAAQGGGMGMLVMMVAIFAIMWLFMIRPQQKKQKEIRNFQNSLQEGTKVVTGIGTGTSETERCLIVKPKEQNRACSESAIARKGAIKQNDR